MTKQFTCENCGLATVPYISPYTSVDHNKVYWFHVKPNGMCAEARGDWNVTFKSGEHAGR